MHRHHVQSPPVLSQWSGTLTVAVQPHINGSNVSRNWELVVLNSGTLCQYQSWQHQHFNQIMEARKTPAMTTEDSLQSEELQTERARHRGHWLFWKHTQNHTTKVVPIPLMLWKSDFGNPMFWSIRSSWTNTSASLDWLCLLVSIGRDTTQWRARTKWTNGAVTRPGQRRVSIAGCRSSSANQHRRRKTETCHLWYRGLTWHHLR